MPRPQHRARNSRNGVSVATDRSRETQSMRGIVKKARRNGESGGHGLVRFHAGTAIPLQHSSEFVVIEPASISFGPIHEILHTRKHRSLCRPIATLWKLPYEFHREVQKVTFSFNGKAHRRSHQSGRFNALHRVMRHHTGSPGCVGERLAWTECDAHRRGTHCTAVGGAESAGLFQTYAFGKFLQRCFGGRSQQVKRSLGLHRSFPLQQIVGVSGVINAAVIVDKSPCEYESLFCIVGDGTSFHIRCDRLLRHGIHKFRDRTVVIPANLLGRHALRRHSQRIAQRKPSHSSHRSFLHLHPILTHSHSSLSHNSA